MTSYGHLVGGIYGIAIGLLFGFVVTCLFFVPMCESRAFDRGEKAGRFNYEPKVRKDAYDAGCKWGIERGRRDAVDMKILADPDIYWLRSSVNRLKERLDAMEKKTRPAAKLRPKCPGEW